MSFTIFQNEKTPFQAIKTRSSKSRKIEIFPKNLVHGFGRKLEIFFIFLISAKQLSKMCLKVFQKEKKLFQTIKRTSQKKSKIWNFFFIGKIAQQNVFESIVKRKQVFPDYKKNKLKKWIKIGIFPKGLVHGFGERFFFIQNIIQHSFLRCFYQ